MKDDKNSMSTSQPDPSPVEQSQGKEETPAHAHPHHPQVTDPVPEPEPQKPAQVLIPTTSHALETGDLKAHRVRGESPLAIFLPNRAVSRPIMAGVIVVEALIALAMWIFSPFKILPQPGEVFAAFGDLWVHQGMGQELASSYGLNVAALLWASLISLGLAYLTVIPLFRPLVVAISKARFLSMVGFTIVFNLIFGGGRPMQVALLTFGISAFYITSMAAVIAAIPKADFDHARTLRMSEWRVVWEVVILGTADKALEVLRQNAAIGWMMLTLVEGLVRSEGGIAVMLINYNKQVAWANVYAIQLLILIVGMGQDYAIGLLRRMVCPFADLTLERK